MRAISGLSEGTLIISGRTLPHHAHYSGLIIFVHLKKKQQDDNNNNNNSNNNNNNLLKLGGSGYFTCIQNLKLVTAKL